MKIVNNSGSKSISYKIFGVKKRAVGLSGVRKGENYLNHIQIYLVSLHTYKVTEIVSD